MIKIQHLIQLLFKDVYKYDIRYYNISSFEEIYVRILKRWAGRFHQAQIDYSDPFFDVFIHQLSCESKQQKKNSKNGKKKLLRITPPKKCRVNIISFMPWSVLVPGISAGLPRWDASLDFLDNTEDPLSWIGGNLQRGCPWRETEPMKRRAHQQALGMEFQLWNKWCHCFGCQKMRIFSTCWARPFAYPNPICHRGSPTRKGLKALWLRETLVKRSYRGGGGRGHCGRWSSGFVLQMLQSVHSELHSRDLSGTMVF